MKSVRYLVRFDDICPSMNWKVWESIEQILLENHIKPILAVVPDNQDPALNIDPPHSDFWARVREWQEWGWTIALHGYQHLSVLNEGGILNLNSKSEFAGLGEQEQREKLQSAMAIFRANNVETHVWLAPFHSFDSTTVKLLPEIGIDTISDGLSLNPYQEEDGILWIPQQMWKFRKMPFGGVWTINNHHNDWNETNLAIFSAFAQTHKNAFTSLTDIKREYTYRRRSIADNLCWGVVKGKLWVSSRASR